MAEHLVKDNDWQGLRNALRDALLKISNMTTAAAAQSAEIAKLKATVATLESKQNAAL
jgi:hypothetical protein